MNENLTRARSSWVRLAKILSSEKVESKAIMATIYRPVSQAVLLYGAESRSMTSAMEGRRKIGRHSQQMHKICHISLVSTLDKIKMKHGCMDLVTTNKRSSRKAELIPIQDYESTNATRHHNTKLH